MVDGGDEVGAGVGSSSYRFSIISSYISPGCSLSAVTMPPTMKSSSKSLNSNVGMEVKVVPVVMWVLGEDGAPGSFG